MLLITRPTVTPVQAMSQKFAGVSAMSARTYMLNKAGERGEWQKQANGFRNHGPQLRDDLDVGLHGRASGLENHPHESRRKASWRRSKSRPMPPHLTSPRIMFQIMGPPIAGRGTAKESSFDACEGLIALPSWKAGFQFPLPAHRLRWVCFASAGRG